MWHWKSVRTGPLGYFDDQFVDATKDPEANRNWGRKNDSKLSGGYKNNLNKQTNGPAFMNTDRNTVAVIPVTKSPFVDNYQAGDRVPGIIITPFTGSRGDIQTRAAWKEGQWTLEIQRKRVTTGENASTQDVQFSDLKKTYHFGVSVFDNTQINHLYHEGVLKFRFR